MEKIIVLGIGHNTPVMIETAETAGYEVAALYHYDDSRTGEKDHGYEIIGSVDELLAEESLEGKSFLLTMGDMKIRKKLSAKILDKGGSLPSVVHPAAVVSRFAKIADTGVYIGPFTYIQPDTTIGAGTVILSGVNISHTCIVGDYCFISGSAVVGAYTEVANNVFIGQSAVIISEKVKTIGENAFIAAGALITKSVPENARMIGVPAVNHSSLPDVDSFSHAVH